MKVPRRRNNKKRPWLAAAGGTKFEPQMVGIPEIDSSRDEEDEDVPDGIYRHDQGSSSSNSSDEEEGFRYLPRQRHNEEEDGSFPSFHAVMPPPSRATVADGSFPRVEDVLCRVGGPLPTMMEASSAASCSSSDKASAGMSPDTQQDNGKGGGGYNNDMETASPTSSQTYYHNEHTHNIFPPSSMRCMKRAITGAGALLVISMIVIAAAILRQGQSNGVVTATDEKPAHPGLDIYVTFPTLTPVAMPTLYPTTYPTVALAMPTLYPTIYPTVAPTIVPTALPEMVAFVSHFPTGAPTNTTSLSLTNATAAPTGMDPACTDDPTATFDINGVQRNCAWLADNAFYQSLLCNEYNYMANTLCPLTCDLCPLPSGGANNTTASTMADGGGV